MTVIFANECYMYETNQAEHMAPPLPISNLNPLGQCTPATHGGLVSQYRSNRALNASTDGVLTI